MRATWQQLQAKLGGEYSQGSPETVAWHQREADVSEKAGQSFAARFHLNRLIEGNPHDQTLLTRRARADSELKKLPEVPLENVYDAWIVQAERFESLHEPKSANEAYTKAVHIIEVQPHIDRIALAQLRMRQFNLRPSLGLGLELDPDHLRWHGIPQRPSEAKSNLIDLSCYYNTGLREEWHGENNGNDLSALPEGVREMAGTEFDIRGAIQLSYRDSNGLKYPDQVAGIKIAAKSQRLHFLHAASHTTEIQYGKSIAKYVIHYRYGRSIEMPVVLGEDVRDWWAGANETDSPARAVVAWRGTNAANRRAGNTGIRLFKRTWENPYPDAEIESLDCISTSAAGNLFIVAITAE